MKMQTALLISSLLTSSAVCSGEIEKAAPSDLDLLARVGDRAITFPQLNTQLNSTAVVGLSTPALGTPERRTVMLTLLDKAISVNLLYLDAMDKSVHESAQFKQEMQTYTDGMLAGLYRKHYLRSTDSVSESEITDYIDKHFAKTFELDEKMRPLIEAKIRKQKYLARKRGLREHLHTGMSVKVHQEHLEIENDSLRSDDQVIAEYGDVSMTWGESKKYLTTLNNSIDMERRLKTLNDLIDNRLLTKKALQAGMQRDPALQGALEEFKNTRLVNLHRSALTEAMQPSFDEIREYYSEHRSRIAFNEHRKLLMVVVEDEKFAEEIMSKLEQGEMTIYQAALNHSIDPRAEQTLGDFGWVEEGSGFLALDELVFSLEIGELGGPVETPAGWHIVVATDQRSSKYTDINDPDTQQQTRRLLLKHRLDEYVISLRENRYPVAVYEENLNRLLLQEAQWIAAKNQEMEKNPQRARIILEEMKALIE
jgi:peptidyl-prolyl cis-trans isomerase C